ncbi:porin family protein [Sphingomonas sp. MA1305]|uniref:outer membrane protein n=1 Tax=Sphingomonas sp. MA1305 TaxID=2479204 RepID=UPI0018E01852|nr:outer membrane beta-barrel protein [Sphingomonas sp. MA1305]MBI0476436.1 porin family protein [Sphingomonas sp. MA1305]
MHTKFLGLIPAAVLAAMAASPAAAQDMSADPEPYNGVYIGAAGGYDVQPNPVGARLLFDRNLDGRFGDTVVTAGNTNAFAPGFCNGAARGATPAAGGCRNDKDGWAYYGRIGADTQRGHVVVGFVGEFGKSEITDSTSGYSTTPASYVLTRDVDYEASIRGRAGLAFGTTLFYGTTGAGYAKIKHSFTTTNTANAFALSGDDTKFGFLAGGGIEQQIGRHFSIGLEYMYHRYNDNDFRVRVTQGSAAATNPFVLTPNTAGTDIIRSDNIFRWHSMRATAAFRF